jgi:hypothetical protein
MISFPLRGAGVPVTRRRAGIALFMAGVALLVAGPWLATDSWVLAACLGGGIVLFALADLVAPFPGAGRRRR